MAPKILPVLADLTYDPLFALLVEEEFQFTAMLRSVGNTQQRILSDMARSLVRACEVKRTAVGFIKVSCMPKKDSKKCERSTSLES